MSEEKNERVGKDKVDKRAGGAGRREKAVPETDNPFEKMRVSSKLQDVFDEKPRRKELFVPFYFAILMAYLELTFHIYTYRSMDWNTVAILLFSTAFAGLIGFLCSLAPRIVNVLLTIFLTILFCVYFCVQIVYNGVFQNHLSMSAMMGVAGQAFDYQDTIMKNIRENIVALILLLVPVVVILTPVRRLIDFKRKKWVRSLIHGVAPFAIYMLGVLFIKLTDTGMYSAYDVYRENTSIDMAVEKLGMTQGTLMDFGVILGVQYGADDEFEFSDAFADVDSFGENENEDVQNPIGDASQPEGEDSASGEQEENSEPVVPRKPTNVLEIDFDELIARTSDEGLISLNEYFRDCTPTNTNQYTGLFEGYNLIWITAEGFSGYALTEENYPTLYKLAHEGFVFNNFYTPLWYGSTVGGEYANLTGLMPANGGKLSMKETGKNHHAMTFCMGTQLTRKGYTTVGYHNNTYTYYGRDMSHTNMGYTWMGVGNGWEPERTKSGKALWPQSDDHMIETTFYDYYQPEPFHVYYLSVSGHVQYNFAGNQMSIRNKEVFADSGYSETTRAYLSCQYELEKAMTRLVGYLEEEGIADHTVIVLSADHVPYDNKEVCDELAGHTLDGNFEWFKNTLIIWSGSMKEPVVVDKVCSSLDILPTVSNLMGLDYDSRLIVGRDILSDCEGLVMFNNRSWITDKAMYNASNGEITYLTDDPVSEDYIKAVKSTVRTRFKVADKIFDYDYYQYIDDLYEDAENIVPAAVEDKMARAGFHTDGTEMTSAELKQYLAEHPEPVESENKKEEYDPSSEGLDENTPVPDLNPQNSGDTTADT